MPSITAANTILWLGATNYLPSQRIQGFAPNTAITVEPVDNAETQMGVDAFFTAGWVPMPVKTTFMLSAASPSVQFFELLYSAEQQIQDKYVLYGSFTFPGLGLGGLRYAGQTAYMRNYSPFAPVEKVLMPRQFQIEWYPLLPSPV